MVNSGAGVATFHLKSEILFDILGTSISITWAKFKIKINYNNHKIKQK